jgi:hypothetical protein
VTFQGLPKQADQASDAHHGEAVGSRNPIG